MPPVGVPFDYDRGQRIEQLRLARAHRFPTQAALAKACGVATRTMSRWVSGYPIEEPNLRVLATELGVSVHYIVKGIEAPSAPVEPSTTGAEQLLLERFSSVEERVEALDENVRSLVGLVERQTETLALLAEREASRPPTTRRASKADSDANVNQKEDA